MPRKTVSMEEAFQELDAILEKLEGKDISLEDSFKIYKEGMKLVQTCNSRIDRVEKEVLKLNENGELDEF